MLPFLKKKKGRDRSKSPVPEQAAAAAAARKPTATATIKRPSRPQAVELGTIDYVNLTPDGKHGKYDAAVQAALETGKPIFANFVEWSG